MGSVLESDLGSGFVSCFASCFASCPGGGGRILSAGAVCFGLIAGVGLRDRELLLQASKNFHMCQGTTDKKAEQNFDWLFQHAQLMLHASATHPDELLLLPELFEELLPEPLEEELEELPEAGDLLDGAMTPKVFVCLC